MHIKIQYLHAANIFNEYFINVGNDLSGSFKQIPLEQSNKTCKFSFNETFLIPIEIEEVFKFIQNLKEDSAPGFDGIPVKIIKVMQNHIVKPLTFIFNVCLKQGIFPNKFKTAIVKPLYELGNKELVSNYGPISMLCNFSKIFEKIIKFKLISYLETNKLLSNNQYGFRPGRKRKKIQTMLYFRQLNSYMKI